MADATAVVTVSIATGPMWAGFIAFVLAMLALDLFVFGGRKAHRVRVQEAAAWVAVWVSLALAFAGLLWWHLEQTQGAEVARTKTLEFIAGYLIEQSLSVDNMFIFVMIFGYFAVPPELQRRVLLYGVLGAIVMRAAMILVAMPPVPTPAATFAPPAMASISGVRRSMRGRRRAAGSLRGSAV